MKMSLICMKKNLQVEHIYIFMALHEDSFDTEAKDNSEMAVWHGTP